ncbi:hypothetical protein AB0L71_15410 [Streptomyces sp. NPDC052052]|uniref:hypothetical protein n=1 Tax=Streptomyces sp. NPDC052052 TaxID=3154756 RepID=UPI00342CF6B0
MLRNHRRKTVLAAAALMASTLLLTACEDGDAESSSTSNGSSAAASASTSATEGKSGDGENGTDGTNAASSKGSNGTSGSKGLTGTWGGTVSYLAPGKYTVTDKSSGTERAFFTAEDTDIEGAGKICGDADGQAATPCSEKQLEAAAKKGFGATVKLKDGIAVSIIEDHTSSNTGGDGASGSNKASGSFSGKLGYLAPGKYTVASGGTERAFFTAEDTDIEGAGKICGDADGQAATPCSEEQLEAAAKKGSVTATVTIKDGVAVSIIEDHQ